MYVCKMIFRRILFEDDFVQSKIVAITFLNNYLICSLIRYSVGFH